MPSRLLPSSGEAIIYQRPDECELDFAEEFSFFLVCLMECYPVCGMLLSGIALLALQSSPGEEAGQRCHPFTTRKAEAVRKRAPCRKEVGRTAGSGAGVASLAWGLFLSLCRAPNVVRRCLLHGWLLLIYSRTELLSILARSSGHWHQYSYLFSGHVTTFPTESFRMLGPSFWGTR